MIRRAIAAALLTGCGDIVVGRFPLAAGEGSADATGEPDLPLPGGCVDEPFDMAEGDPWITWADGDATIMATDGALTLLPATSPGVAAGLVLSNTHAFDFAAAHARIEVVTPPDPNTESELFLQVTQLAPQTNAILSMGLYRGTVRVSTSTDEGPLMMTGPVATAYPHWIGIRTEDDVVYFETSDDGENWTTLTTAEQPTAFPGAAPLVMVWNNPSATPIDARTVVVDNLEICAE